MNNLLILQPDLKYLPEDVLTIDKLTSNGRSKYKTYTFNGSIEDGMSTGDYGGIIKVSDDMPDFNNIKEIMKYSAEKYAENLAFMGSQYEYSAE